MADISTTYMGMKIPSPVIVASSNMTRKLDNIKALEEYGAGAIVLKSLFEEQVQKEMIENSSGEMGPSWHTEAYEYIQKMGMELGPREHLSLIEEAKRSVNIPIIASLNCVNLDIWKKYSRQLENAGADAIELNISFITDDLYEPEDKIENRYFEIVETVKNNVSVPVSVKIGPYFTSFGNFARELCRSGADSLVLFNRFYRFDINIEKMEITGGNPLSSRDETSIPLRWVSLLSGRIDCEIASTTGIHEAEDVVKHILAGAQVTQVCSVLFKKGKEYLKELNDGLKNWLDEKGYSTVDEVRGKLSFERSNTPEAYERLQYIKAIIGIG